MQCICIGGFNLKNGSIFFFYIALVICVNRTKQRISHQRMAHPQGFGKQKTPPTGSQMPEKKPP